MSALLICKARIARALCELETALDCEVESIVLRDVDVTTVGDQSPQYVRNVELRLRRRPIYGWATYPDLPGV